ncbi:MAG: sigma 54-interacting transcriptional regulator [Pseudomonadota bacterium]|nr:sigma 54-interacting transcriptional regulator [Pseudomonadota bacterium]
MDETEVLLPPELAGLVESHSDPAMLISPDYRIVAVSPVYRRAYGDLDLSQPKYCYEISHEYLAPCDQAGEECPLQSVKASGQPRRMVHVHHTPRGEEHIDKETLPVKSKDGRVWFLQVFHTVQVASAQFTTDKIVGRSHAFNRMVELIHRVAPSETAVLLSGETGTGKELVAQAIHGASPRREGPFVPIDCSGLTESLFEAELFGHEKGAFTGALSAKQGLVEAASGGTLFLDEIGDVPLQLQVKLLRLLETDAFRRVGSAELRQASFRLVCATHRDLEEMVETEQFRKDLFYRINIFPIAVPPLKGRRKDIPLLAEVLLYQLRGKASPQLHPQALACLEDYDYPGNIRELRHILERALLLTDGNTILPTALPKVCHHEVAGGTPAIYPLKEAEERYLRYLKTTYKGDRKTLARSLGISERTLYRKFAELGNAGGHNGLPDQ